MTSPETPLDAAAGREHSAAGSVRASLAAILNRYDEMLNSITRTSPSDHLGACGHELDPWETHLAHRPDCPRELCLEDRCDCPEVCPDCCRSCGYDTAERMGS